MGRIPCNVGVTDRSPCSTQTWNFLPRYWPLGFKYICLPWSTWTKWDSSRQERPETIPSRFSTWLMLAVNYGLCIFLGTDAEKAFDQVNWQFMFAALRHIGLRDTMVRWISSLYSSLTAEVRVNGVLSSPFPVTNGTRQGCPLSPLLFALTLEPFLCTVRSNPDIQGLCIGRSQHKVSAYAYDMLFFDLSINLPPQSVQRILTIWISFLPQD